MANATGIILCGGKSVRFGKDKGLCILGNKPLIRYAIDCLSDVCIDIIISSNNPEYMDLGFKTISDKINNIGPVGGILSALEISGTEDNLIISCDMPLLKTELYEYILKSKENALAAAPVFNNHIEPLCSYFNRKSIQGIKSFIKNNNYKIIDILESINYKKITIDSSLPFFSQDLFLNINTPSQYEIALELLNRDI